MKPAVVRYRFWPLAFLLVTTLVLGAGALRFRIARDLSFLVPQNHPYTRVNQEMEEDFGGGNLVSVGLRFRKGNIFEANNLRSIIEATQNLLDTEGVYRYRVLSIAANKLRYLYTTQDPDGLEVLHAIPFRELAERALKGDVWALNALKQGILRDPQVFGTLVSKDLKGALVQADFSPYTDPGTIYGRLKRLERSLEEQNPSLQVSLAGQPVEIGAMLEGVKRFVFVGVVALVLMGLALWVMFHSKRGVFLPLSGALMSLIWCLGIMGWLKVRLDVMALTAPFLIVALSVGHSIQVLKRFYENYAFEKNKDMAAHRTILGLIVPTSAGIITDGTGFVALSFFPFQGLQNMGILAGLGILSVFFTVLLYIPLMCTLMSSPKLDEIKKAYKLGLLDRFFLQVARKAKTRARFVVMFGLLVIVGVFGYGASKLQYGDLDKGSYLFWPKSKVNKDIERIGKYFAGSESYMLQIKGQGEGAIANVELLKRLDELERLLLQKPYVGYVSHYGDILKNIHSLWAKTPRPEIPPTDQLAYVYLEMFVSGGGDPEDTRSFFTMDYSRANMLILLKDRQNKHLDDLERTISAFWESKPPIPGIEIRRAGGTAALYYAAMQSIANANMPNVLLVSIVVLILALLSYRSLLAACILLVPLAVASLITAGVMGFGRLGMFIPTVPVASLGIGIGVDFSFYMLSRIKEEFQNLGSLDQAVVRALASSGKAVLFTAVTLSLGSLALLGTGLKVHGYLGGLLALDFLANMVLASAVLPFLVFWIRPKFLTQAESLAKTHSSTGD